MAFWQVLDDKTAGGHGPPVQPGTEPIDHDGGQAGPRGDGWEGFPVGGTYAQGVAWIVMILARALQYAHGKLTYHRDVKPANVLLTLLNGPQLLDFNLAESPHSADRAQAALHGGTPPYMAPEQIEAFLNPELWGKVGAQGGHLFPGSGLARVVDGSDARAARQDGCPPPASCATCSTADRSSTSRSAASIRRSPIRSRRSSQNAWPSHPRTAIPSAESLAQDLERFLNHQPLLDAPNPSRRERVSNWVTRQRPVLRARPASWWLGSWRLESWCLGSCSRARSTSGSSPWSEASPIFQSAVR